MQNKTMIKQNPAIERQINIATGTSRFAQIWKNQSFTIGDFIQKLQQPTITPETVEEFHGMTKVDQDNAKDQGGYVGGTLHGGRRLSHTVANRSIVTLDLDHAGKNTTDDILQKAEQAFASYGWVAHCTHKHIYESPRLRLIFFLSRPVFADEYQAVALKLASKMGMDFFDDCTFQPHRLMYWPSIPTGLEYVFVDNFSDAQQDPLVPVDDLLAEYGPDDLWQDTTLWPTSSRQSARLKKAVDRQADPLRKKEMVGAFCRVYHPIHKAIQEFLSDVYRYDGGNRYTYIEGTSSKGLVIYEDKFAYSNHGTDPASGQLCNSFDLVRIHKFLDLDQNCKPNTPTNKLPSYQAMTEFAGEIAEVKADQVKSMMADAKSLTDDDNEWINRLDLYKDGTIKPTFGNVTEIMTNDPDLKERVWYNELSGLKEKGKCGPEWTDEDTLDVRKYLQDKYALNISGTVAHDSVIWRASKKSYHPIREYLDSVNGKWDGEKRLETLWIDYLGEEDNLYTRESAKCFLMAAVTRIYSPGYKFDYTPVISGAQGIGKSTFCRILAKKPAWFGELTIFDDQKSVEQMMGKWILELGELNVNRKSELEQQKQFLSRQEDRVRLAYRRDPGVFKRQCVFIGSTNRQEYLKDTTGNRRWWPLQCGPKFKENSGRINTDKLKKEIDQIWAEAVELYCDMDSTTELSPEALDIAMQRQRKTLEADEWEGIIEAWLEEPASKYRYCNNYSQINKFFEGNGDDQELRDRVNVLEIWEDCLGMSYPLRKYDRNRISGIMDRLPGWEKCSTVRFGERFGRQRGWVVKTMEQKHMEDLAGENV